MRQRELRKGINTFARFLAILALLLGIVMLGEGFITMTVQLYNDNPIQAHNGLFEAIGGVLVIGFAGLVFHRTKIR